MEQETKRFAREGDNIFELVQFEIKAGEDIQKVG